MNPASRTVFYFGFYEISVALLFLLAPGLGAKLVMLEVPAAALDLLRVPGAMACVFAYYYFRCGLANDLHFARFSVHGRIALALAFPALVVAGALPLAVVGFGLVDFVTALWTRSALRSIPANQPTPGEVS